MGCTRTPFLWTPRSRPAAVEHIDFEQVLRFWAGRGLRPFSPSPSICFSSIAIRDSVAVGRSFCASESMCVQFHIVPYIGQYQVIRALRRPLEPTIPSNGDAPRTPWRVSGCTRYPNLITVHVQGFSEQVDELHWTLLATTCSFLKLSSSGASTVDR